MEKGFYKATKFYTVLSAFAHSLASSINSAMIWAASLLLF